jgi:hypothetical protein
MNASRALPVVRIGTTESEVEDLLERFQQLVLEHPVAAQAIVSALIAEGRRHAQTPDGVATLARIRRSELARRGRILWESSVLNMLEERDEHLLPSALIDAMLGALLSDDLEDRLTRSNPLARTPDTHEP